MWAFWDAWTHSRSTLSWLAGYPTWSISPASTCPGVLANPPRLICACSLHNPIEKSEKIMVREVTFTTWTGGATTSSLRGSLQKQRLLLLNYSFMSPTPYPQPENHRWQQSHPSMITLPWHALKCTLPRTQMFHQMHDRAGKPRLRAVLWLPAAKLLSPLCSPICIHFMHLILTALVNSSWKEKKTLVSPTPELLLLVKCH